MNNVIDLSAKLLANEDINVTRANTKTASFDIKSRLLTLPQWQDMTPTIEQMLVGHEVGHALYTTEEYMEPIKENSSLRSYLNVLEDVRIEKLMKKKYPGIRKHMAAGYKELNDRDFFDIEGKDVNRMLLIDKINLYFKASLFGLDFTPEEKQFVIRAERTESIQDVIELAKEVYEYSKEEYEKMMEEMENDPMYQDDEDEDAEDLDLDMDGWDDGESDDEDEEVDGGNSYNEMSDDEDDGEEQEQVYQRGAEGQSDDPLESKTQQAFDKNLNDLADTETVQQYFKFHNDNKDRVIDFKRILKELREDLDSRHEVYGERFKMEQEDFTKFKEESNKTVNYLVKEFEMRKSATAYKRTQTAKTGSLDMKKIFGYQINDDLFKRVQMIPEGKNHGMMILVDWSGSMQNVITNTIKQVINLAMFCQRTQIPYRVFAFTNHYYDKTERLMRQQMTYEEWGEYVEKERTEYNAAYESDQAYIFAREYNMLELFSNQMTSSDFWTMSRMLLDPALIYSSRYGLGSTPLNEALIWIYNNIGKFIKNNNVEKMTFITLTDGEGADFTTNKSLRERVIKKYGYYSKELDRQIENEYTNYRNMIVDEVTKKTYRIKQDSNSQTRMMIRMIKDRYDVRTVGFYICQNTRRDMYWAIRSNSNMSNYDFNEVVREMRKNFRENGFHSMVGSGRDELFIIPQNKMNIEQEELQATGEMSARKLASQFGKYLNKKKTSRVLLNKFIGWVA